VTHPRDGATADVAKTHRAGLFFTESFYADGAAFNKWRALEEGLNAFGREGWIVLMDADVLWPKFVPDYPREIGFLYGPVRRMYLQGTLPIPQEEDWAKLSLHRNLAEWAGYGQIFHADDPHLPAPPWHAVDWEHAGGADSFFQALWLPACKIRPPFEALHIGAAGRNWYGRATPNIVDGSLPAEAARRLNRVRRIWQVRKARRRRGLDAFAEEKLSAPVPPIG